MTRARPAGGPDEFVLDGPPGQAGRHWPAWSEAPTIEGVNLREAARGRSRPRGPDPGAGIGRILLATDLSPVSHRAAGEAVRIALEHGAELLVLSVVDPARLRLPGGRFLRRVDQERTRVESGVRAVVLRARDAGLKATFLVWEGDPADTILSAAAAERADLIVIGSHGRGRVGRFVLGTVSGRVAEGARCTVLVITASPVGADDPRSGVEWFERQSDARQRL